MAKTDAEFHALMNRVIAGSEEAAEELFRDYEPFLRKVIRKRLSKRLRQKFDSQDFSQEVWASFFTHDADERIFRTPQDLIGFLVTLAQNKVVDATRQRLKTDKHAGARVQSMDDSRRFDKEQLIGSDPTPSHVMSKEEEWKSFLRQQPIVYRRIFVLMREGKTRQEIADELVLSIRTVNRAINRLAPRTSHDANDAIPAGEGGQLDDGDSAQPGGTQEHDGATRPS